MKPAHWVGFLVWERILKFVKNKYFSQIRKQKELEYYLTLYIHFIII